MIKIGDWLKKKKNVQILTDFRVIIVPATTSQNSNKNFQFYNLKNNIGEYYEVPNKRAGPNKKAGGKNLKN